MGDLEPVQRRQQAIDPEGAAGSPAVGNSLRIEELAQRALHDGQMDFRMVNNLHMFPSTQICQACMEFPAEVQVKRAGQPAGETVDARSVLSLLTLAAEQGTLLTVSVKGEGAEQIWNRFLRLELWAAVPAER